MSDKTMKAAWDEYNRRVLPRDAPPVQRSETRRAFYAGAWAMFCLVADVGEDAVDEEAGVEIIEALRVECVEFAEAIKAGRA